MTDHVPTILAFGDSLIAGYGLRRDEGLPAQLERRLRARHSGASVIDAGMSGDTSEGAQRRLPRVLGALMRRPDLALVQIGPNDVLRGIAPERMRVALDAILLEFGRCEIPVLLATVAPPAFLADRTRGYAGVHEEVARLHRVATVAFFPRDVLGHPDMVLADRIHPNARAIAAVADHLLPAIERALGVAVLP